MKKILYTGKTSRKILDHYRYPKMEAEITPSIVIQDGVDPWGTPEQHMGILLHCLPVKLLEERADYTCSSAPFELFDGNSFWFDPVRWWRAIQLIEVMSCLRDSLTQVYVATSRHTEERSSLQDEIQEVQEALDPEHSYEDIMARPIPQSLLQVVMEMAQGEFKDSLELDSITDEIEAGTIRWSQDLKRIGVSHPDYRRAVAAMKAEIVTRYDAFLCSYAAFRHYTYEIGLYRIGS